MEFQQLDDHQASRIVQAVIGKHLVRDYEVPDPVFRPDVPYIPGSPLDMDEPSEPPGTKVKSLVNDADFLEMMEKFCQEVQAIGDNLTTIQRDYHEKSQESAEADKENEGIS